MEQLFLTILNRAVTAGWLVLLVMVLRVVLKKAPRAAHYGLWAIVAVRLLWPGDLLPRAGVSLVPTTEPISGDVLTAAGTAVSGGLPAVGSPAGAAAAETAARTGQSLGHIAAVVWLVGMAAMALCYEAASMGLGTCMIGTMNQEKLHQYFGIPAERVIRLIITVGYPAKEGEPRRKKRKSLDEILSYNHW